MSAKSACRNGAKSALRLARETGGPPQHKMHPEALTSNNLDFRYPKSESDLPVGFRQDPGAGGTMGGVYM